MAKAKVKLNTNELVVPVPVTFGADPELFVSTIDGEIVGAEKVLPKDGLPNADLYGNTSPSVVIDGVQVELHPSPSTCRAGVGNSLKMAFKSLDAQLKKMSAEGKQLTMNFTQVVEVSQKELESLSAESRRLGCAPSLNTHDPAATIKCGEGFTKRAAGGHLHLGLVPAVRAKHQRIIPIMDILVGNTAVLIDRDPGAALRRQEYGRAGEYRIPNHGIEYRVLSNFWLRSYQLMSFVMGLTRLAVGVIETTDWDHAFNSQAGVRHATNWNHQPKQWDAEGDLLKRVDIKKVVEAINTNNLDLAKENYAGVRDFIAEHVAESNGDWSTTGLDSAKLDLFDFFIKKIDEKGIGFWFPDDAMTHWTTMPEGHDNGWESFLTGIRGNFGGWKGKIPTVASVYNEEIKK